MGSHGPRTKSQTRTEDTGLWWQNCLLVNMGMRAMGMQAEGNEHSYWSWALVGI